MEWFEPSTTVLAFVLCDERKQKSQNPAEHPKHTDLYEKHQCKTHNYISGDEQDHQSGHCGDKKEHMKPSSSDQRMYDSGLNRIHSEVKGQAEKDYSDEKCLLLRCRRETVKLSSSYLRWSQRGS